MWHGDQFDVTRLKQLQGEAEALAGQLSAAAEASKGQFTGRDNDGAVEVTVGDDGSATRVDLDPQWRRTVGDGLGLAVVAALQDSAAQRMAAWGSAPAAPAEATPAPDPTRGTEIGDPSSRQSMLALRDLFDLIGEVTAGLHDLSHQPGAQPVSSTNNSRTVRVTAAGGTVSSVDFDDEWLRAASHERIAQAVLEALEASARDAAAERQRAVDAVPGLGRVQRLTESPETLLREIGLIR
ncbi:hypothetical protein JIG36_35230 [Actinoplanes sp. LDG1-06]|uniref:YbaB/EbfC DNA-binding family protein n=1 Tax=Paractinoplanes ovalisporus TaxID=2810368 RepID=A0ABS2ANG0_9ACTN|nr:YbaB/EbfC family nucleoid-associated protein [Actinoplanes ovalisporus]MBM2620766.1 hypothetical protein [Actinoplanes ovalisporus]